MTSSLKRTATWPGFHVNHLHHQMENRNACPLSLIEAWDMGTGFRVQGTMAHGGGGGT